MSRTLNCIKMLLLLQSRGAMNKEELAEALSCNGRNIREYRKELEEAGYEIEIIYGKEGGYRLKKGTLFPVVGLTQEEFQALSEAQSWLNKQGFRYAKAFQSAVEKLKATTSMTQYDSDIYSGAIQTISSVEKMMMDTLSQAKRSCNVVRMQYRGTKDDHYQNRMIHPYEIVHINGSAYVVAYDLRVKDYRSFKIHEERMRYVEMQDHQFLRDEAFDIRTQIGQHSIIHNETIALHLLVKGRSIRYLKEHQIGSDKVLLEREDGLEVFLRIEGREAAIAFLLSLRSDVQILEPLELKQELLEIISNMQTQYNSN